MSNEQLSRRQKAKLREQAAPKVVSQAEEAKSLFSAFSNNSNINVNLFDQLMKLMSSDAKLSQIVSGNSTIATCLDIIAMKIATIPLNLYKQKGDGTFAPVKGKRFNDHNFSKPNNTDTQTTFLYKMVTNFLVYGNTYLISANKQLFVVPPTRVFPNKVGGIIKDYRVVLDNQLTDSITIPASLVCQLFKPGLDNTYTSAVKNVIADSFLNSEIIDRVCNHVKSGMMAKGYLQQTDGTNVSSTSVAQLTQLARSFTENTQGDKASNTIALPRGIEYKVIASSLADSAMPEFLDISRKQIVRSFKIPETLFNSEAGGTFATANIQEVNFYKNTIMPICTLIESFINYWNEVTNETEYFRFELGLMVSAEEEKMRADTRSVNANTASTLNALKLFSPNEIREASGHDDIVDSNEQPIPEAETNPFELGQFNATDNTTITEPVDAGSIVKKIDIVQTKKASHKCEKH